MLSKISVKKPYTVLVGVVLIIVLGVMSLRNMSTDLLPDMELPYAIVMTTYPGASPEEVESTVTKPVEQAMAGISNMKKVSSISNSNVSIVILQFNDGADMNTATIDMRESLDNISASWSDSIGSPTIMKINPDMMPIMVAAIDCDKTDRYQLVDKMNKDILPELESVEGVASVSTSGEVKKKMEVVLKQDKIDAVNKRVQNAINGKFSDAEKKISQNEDKVKDGKQTLSTKQEEAAQKLADGSTALDKNGKKISDTLVTINNALAELNLNEKTLQESEKQIKSGKTQVATTKAQLKATISSLTAAKKGLEKIKDALDSLYSQKASLEQMIETSGETTELRTKLIAVEMQIKEAEKQLTAQGMTREDLTKKLKDLNSGLTQAQSGLDAIEKQEEKLQASQKKITAGRKKIAAAKKKLLATKAQLEAGEITIESAKNELNKQTTLAAIKLSVANMEVNTGSNQLKEARKSLQDAKKTAKQKSDLNAIITKSMIEGILTAQNFEMPAGYVTEDDASYLVKVGEEIQSQKDLEDLVLCDLGIDGLRPIRLSDVADIAVTDNADKTYTVVNGNPAIALTIEKATGYSTGNVTHDLVKRMNQLEKQVKGLHVSVLMNQGVYIDMVVNSVVQNLLVGAFLAIIILFFFLKDIRPTLIVACSIPLSVVAAIVLMYFSNVTLNVISLSGLALGVGMLVDNSIVVIENIFRMRQEEGASVKKAAIEGAKQVAGAITASTLTTVCVFAPIIFTEGLTRQLFVDLALTLAYSLLASLVVSLTLVPAMAQGLLRKEKKQKDKIEKKGRNWYAILLEKVLHKKALVLLGALVLLVVFVGLAFSRGTVFMPSMGSTQMTATLSAPKDKEMTDQELYALSNKVIKRIVKVDGVDKVGAMSGGGGVMSMMSGGSKGGISMYILLDENTKRSNKDIKEEIEKRTKDLKCDLSVAESAMDMSSMMGSSGMTIEVKGKDLDKLQKITEDIIKKVQNVEGIETITNGMEDSEQEFRITVDKDKAMKYSLTVAQVFQQVNERLSEAKKATTLSTDTDSFGVYVSSEKDTSMSRKQLKNLKLTYTDTETQQSKTIKLSKVAKFTMADSPTSIHHDNQTRYMSVSITIDDNHNIGLVSDKVKGKLKSYHTPAGYEIKSTGEDETINDAMGQVVLMMVVGVLFMYLIMVAQFQSLLSPFIILFTIPLAFTGGFMGLYFSGSEVSVIAMIGFVMLAGIIVNNGIVLVDYINQLRASGVEKYKAIIMAGSTRIRPILMTALTTVLGLLPMLITNDNGSDMVKPMAIVTIGGLVYGTLLTLFVVPCIYAVLNRKSDAKLVEAQLDE